MAREAPATLRRRIKGILPPLQFGAVDTMHYKIKGKSLYDPVQERDREGVWRHCSQEWAKEKWEPESMHDAYWCGWADAIHAVTSAVHCEMSRDARST